MTSGPPCPPQANVITALNSATPGLLGFYNGSLVDKLRTTVFDATDLQNLAASGTQDSVLDPSRTFLSLLDDCQVPPPLDRRSACERLKTQHLSSREQRRA